MHRPSCSAPAATARPSPAACCASTASSAAAAALPLRRIASRHESLTATHVVVAAPAPSAGWLTSFREQSPTLSSIRSPGASLKAGGPLLPIAAASVLVPRPARPVTTTRRPGRQPGRSHSQSRVAFNLTAARHAAATALSDSDADPHHPCPVPPGGRAFDERAGDPVPVLQRWDR